MNLRLKPFEKSIRRRVRRELRQSPAAWKEYRRVRRRREFHLPQWLFRCIVLLVVSSAWTSNRKPTGTLVAMIVLWAAASVTWRAGQLLIALRASPTLLVLAHVPIPDADVFKFQWQTFLRVSLWSVLDFTALYGVLAERVGYGWDSLWVGLFLAVIQWLVMVSLAAGLLIYVRRRKFFRFAGVFAALAVLLAIGVDLPSLTQFLTVLAYWIPPMGWILYAVGISPAQNILLGWWPALSMSAAVFALPLFYRRLRTR